MSVACRDLFKVYRTAEGDAAALQGLTLDAHPGEMVAVLGPSGSGKSTLLRILAGLETPSAGSALIAGNDMARLDSRRRALVRRRHIGFVGQRAQLSLSPVMTIAEAVSVPLLLRGAGADAARKRAHELIERLGLPEAARGAHPHELSGGEGQRAAVCVAVAHGPDVVLADEPTGELDAHAAREVLALLRELADESQATVVMVTHDPVGADVAHRVIRVRDGRVSAEDAGSRRAVVIGKGGWLHVPEEILARAGIRDRALLRAESDAVVLEPVAHDAAPTDPDAARAPRFAGHDSGGASAVMPQRVTGARLELRAISKSYGDRQVFADATFTFEPGRFTAATGRSGSGKSTLLRLAAGLELPDAGSVTVDDNLLDGLDREQLAALRAVDVGFVAQDVQLAGFLSAHEHVMLPLVRAGRSRADAAAAAASWLTVVGLGEREGQRIERLSGGERQRVALARALAGGRRLLLVDEPTSRLDEASAAAVARLLREMADDYGVTIVCATHDSVVADAAHSRLPLDP